MELLRDPLAFLEAAAARHGGAASLVLGGERVVLVSDPGLAQAVLVDHAADFVKVGRLERCAAIVLDRQQTVCCASSFTWPRAPQRLVDGQSGRLHKPVMPCASKRLTAG